MSRDKKIFEFCFALTKLKLGDFLFENLTPMVFSIGKYEAVNQGPEVLQVTRQ